MGRTRVAAEFVAPIFKANKWEWAMVGDGVGVPNEAEIYSTLKRLQKDAKKSKGFIETGRLLAHWNDDFKKVEYYLALPTEKDDFKTSE